MEKREAQLAQPTIELMIELSLLSSLLSACSTARTVRVRVRSVVRGASGRGMARKNDKSAKHETNSPLPLHNSAQ